jgi:hypothetical protein
MRELTGFDVLIRVCWLGGIFHQQWSMRKAKRCGECTYYWRLVYLIDEKQLTKDLGGSKRVISGVIRHKRGRSEEEKRFSHHRS